jgi:hypothetical protein
MIRLRSFVVVLAILAGATAARAQEEDITLKQLPKAVVEAIKAKYEGAKLVSAEKETQKDKVFYEVNIKHKDKAIELLLTPEGKIVSVEQPIEAKDLPKAVTEAIAKRYPKAAIKSAEETTKDNKATYAVLLENDVMIGNEKQKVQLALTSAGEIQATQSLIAAKDLPKAVQEALAKKYPNTPITRANEMSQGGKTTYLAILDTPERRHMAVLDGDGKIIREATQEKKKK